MAISFIHLHCHSNFSLLDGIITIDSLIDRAKYYNMKALALTDHNNLYGAVDFYEKCLKNGIKPVIGSEITLDDDTNVVLLAKTRQGYNNLCSIITTGNLKGGHLRFELTRKDILKNRKGLVLLSGGKKGFISRAVGKREIDGAVEEIIYWKKLFGNDFYIEMQNITPDDKLLNYRLNILSEETGVKCAATNNIHLLKQEDINIRRLMHSIDENTNIGKLNLEGSQEEYFKSPKQMSDLFKRYPEALKNTLEIANKCNFSIQLNKPIFPKINMPEGETPFSLLWNLCFEGLKKRYKPVNMQATERLEYELKTIDSLGFSEYFLIVWDIVQFCKKEGIPCIGRGSAADSLVSYALEITKVDPIKYDLYFERFLNPERKEPPDIDLDLCWKSRDNVIEYVYSKYGADKTAMISMFVTFKTRSSIGDTAKALGLPEDEVRVITKTLPYSFFGTYEGGSRIEESDEIDLNNETFRNIIKFSKSIESYPRHLSIHPGGIVIAPDRLTNYSPLEVAGKEIVVTQHDMYSIQKLGLVKMDLLGVRSLSIIADCLKMVGIKDLSSISEDDPETIKLIKSANTIGCFQLESPGMRNLIRKMQIENLDDIIAAISVIRPGPAEGGMKDAYIKRRGGLEKVKYLHPSVEEVLKDTYGVILYQEQVLLIANRVADFTLGEADILRRAMTKDRNKKNMQIIQEKFFKGAAGNGIPKDIAEKIFKQLSNFGGYGFNKAHSSTYGLLSYQSAYIKRYFPVEFFTSVLNNGGGFYSRAEYVEDARRNKVKILSPDINKSADVFTIENNTIRCGLGVVAELARTSIGKIIKERKQKKYSDIYDFLNRVKLQERELENLIKCGALSSLEKSEPNALTISRIYYKNGRKTGITREFVKNIDLPPYSIHQRVLNELEILKLSVSAHPLDLFPEIQQDTSIVPSNELENHSNNNVRVAGWMVTGRTVGTKNGENMRFLTIEDKAGLIECVLFPAVFKKYKYDLRNMGPFIVTGKVQSRLKGEANLIVEKLKLVTGKMDFDGKTLRTKRNIIETTV